MPGSWAQHVHCGGALRFTDLAEVYLNPKSTLNNGLLGYVCGFWAIMLATFEAFKIFLRALAIVLSIVGVFSKV